MKKLAVLLATLLVVACQNPPKKDLPQASQTDTGNTPAASAATANEDKTSATAAENTSIYFDLDKSVVQREYSATIQKEAQAINSAKSGNVTLEGNCDERGSAEYNLGLGQRRADAVKKLLTSAGAPAKRIKTVSLGKEKPKATCHDESCWKENRRVDFVQGS